MPKLIILVFCGFGILCLAASAGLAWYISRSLTEDLEFIQAAKSAEGNIIGYVEEKAGIKIGETASARFPRIEFFVDEKRYEFVSSVASPPFYFWGNVQVAYSPLNPMQAKVNSLYFRFFHHSIASLFSLFFALGGLILIGWGTWNPIKNLILRRTGTEISAKVVGIRQSNEWVVQNSHPWVVDLEWTDESGKTWTISSEGLWINPSQEIPIGSKLAVYVDLRNPSKKSWVKLPEHIVSKNPLLP